MPLYEHIFLGRQDITAQQFEAPIETYQSIIKDKGGSVEKMENWGPKVLAYKIKKNRKAHFALMNIDAPHDAVAEMERQMGISTDVIRFLTLRVEEHETGPSAMMKRGERDDRRGGRHGRDSGRRDRDDSYSRACQLLLRGLTQAQDRITEPGGRASLRRCSGWRGVHGRFNHTLPCRARL